MQEYTSLKQLGWTSQHSEELQNHTHSHLRPARVVSEHRGAYRVHTGQSEHWAECTGKMYHTSNSKSALPAVGDWVLTSQSDSTSRAQIHHVLSRKSLFSRRGAGNTTEEQIVATNIDTLFLTSALDLDFNVRRIERYLVLAWESGAQPVILLTKADKCTDVEAHIEAVETIAYGVPIHAVSALHNSGLEALGSYLEEGQTVALLGSSGVGKSTLLNALSGAETQRVHHVREHDHRGQHTTTARQLFLLPTGGMLIDTPGMRELQLWNGHEGFQQTFEDIEHWIQQCKFRNCKHQTEPGCAVLQAVEHGELSSSRLDSYQKLQRELQYLERKQNTRLRIEEEKKWKQISIQSRKNRDYLS